MVLLAERAQQGDLRSRRIEFEQLTSPFRIARLSLEDGTWVDVCKDGHGELLVLHLPEIFHQEVLTALAEGHGGRDPLDVAAGQLQFRINLSRGGTHGHRVEIGSTLWVKCYHYGKFIRVFPHFCAVVEASFWTQGGYVPPQR